MKEKALPRNQPFARKIVRVVATDREKVSTRGSSFRWRVITSHKVTAECGHTRVYNGYSHPKKFFVCNDCAEGKPWKKVRGKKGVIRSAQKINDPIAAAFIATRRERTDHV